MQIKITTEFTFERVLNSDMSLHEEHTANETDANGYFYSFLLLFLYYVCFIYSGISTKTTYCTQYTVFMLGNTHLKAKIKFCI